MFDTARRYMLKGFVWTLTIIIFPIGLFALLMSNLIDLLQDIADE